MSMLKCNYLSDDTTRSDDKRQELKKEIDAAYQAIGAADENGLFKHLDEYKDILEKLRAARADLETENFSQCENNAYEAEQEYSRNISKKN